MIRRIQDFCLSLSRAAPKSQLPSISRFLIVATFYEDALRICYQWSEQIKYLMLMHRVTRTVAVSFFGANVVLMSVFATCIIFKKLTGCSIAVLSVVMLAQAFAYGILFDTHFILRNLSVLGGLLLCLCESLFARNKANYNSRLFVTLPMQNLAPKDRYKYLQLAGRTLTVLLFFAYFLLSNGEQLDMMGNFYFRLFISALGFIACSMIIVGFRAKWSATILMSILSIVNVMANNWWDRRYSSYRRDFMRYDFFQYLSIIGGLLLLVSIGPGGLSYDEQKKKKQF